jgi:hypothetical protein
MMRVEFLEQCRQQTNFQLRKARDRERERVIERESHRERES